MLKRKAMHYIKKWVDSKNKKCLVIQGARQTGKTYIVERFAEENYEEIVEINFKQIPSAMDIFSGDLTVDNMVLAMRFRFPEKKIIPGKTMIFLDEIQEILARCGMGEIYIVNPYECFILMCLLTDCPLAVFSEIWEKSYEEGEEKN